MTTTPETTTPRRTHRPKQPENALPDPATKPRYCCAKSKGEDPTAPNRVIVVDEVRFDPSRDGGKGDHRIGYYNEATKRRGESWYASFKSGAEFWPAPPMPAPVVEPLIPPLPVEWEAMAINTGKPFGERGAYSSDCYADWRGIVWHLYQRGATLHGAETLLRSKQMRWCADNYDGKYGTIPVTFFAKFMDDTPSARDMAGIPGPLNADPQPVTAVPVAAPAVAPAPASHPTAQLPLTLAVHPVDGARALALLERIADGIDALVRVGATMIAVKSPEPTTAKPANDRAA